MAATLARPRTLALLEGLGNMLTDAGAVLSRIKTKASVVVGLGDRSRVIRLDSPAHQIPQPPTQMAAPLRAPPARLIITPRHATVSDASPVPAAQLPPE